MVKSTIPAPIFFKNSDPLSAYLKDIQATNKLTSDEEKILTVKIRNGDQSAINTLVEANLKFVVMVCRRYENQGMPLIDLINEGNLGLIRAAHRFDETRDLRFISYAVWWIRQAIFDALSKQGRSISMPPNTATVIHNINKASKRLEQKLGRLPSVEEMELETGMDASRIQEYQRVSAPMLSLDFENKDNESDFHNFLADQSDSSTEKEFDRFETKELAEKLLQKLNAREREVVALHYGTENGNPMSLEDIGNRFGLSKERIRQIRNNGLAKLKKLQKSEV